MLKILAIFVVIIFALVLFHRRSEQHLAKIEVFTRRAIQKFLHNESPIALQYILIAYSVSAGPQKNKVLTLWMEARDEVSKMTDRSEKKTRQSRVNKIENALYARRWGFKESLALKKELEPKYFSAWRRLDPSILDEL